MKNLEVEFQDYLVMAGNADGSITYMIPLVIDNKGYLVTYDQAQHISNRLADRARKAAEASRVMNGL